MPPVQGKRITPVDVERIVPFEILLDRIAEDRESAWIHFRRSLHAAPELSGRETATTAILQTRLQHLQLSTRIPERGVGVIADLTIGNPDERAGIIAIRADIDALPIIDRKSVEYCSAVDGVAHACGHDVHSTVVLAAAEMLSTLAEKLNDSEMPSLRLRFIFQSAEETCEGALWMVHDGALDGVTAILGLHVDPLIAAGRIGIRYGVLTAQVDEVRIDIRGTGGHAARPQHTTDPVAASAMLISSLYQAIPRHVDTLIPTVFTIGSIHAGTASNIIPDHVEITGTLRSTDSETRLRVLKLVRAGCDAVASMSGSSIHVEFRSPLGSVVNDTTVISAYEAAARQVVGESEIVLIDRPSMGGEDFAMYLDHVRGAQIRLGCAGDAEDWPLLHSPVFDIDETAIAVGARVIARAALVLGLMPRGGL